MITVFYDGACGLCRREIAHYMRIAPAGVFHWVNLSIDPDAFTQRGYALRDGLNMLHVEDAAGTMHTGVAAFALLWRHLPRAWPLLAHILRIPGVRPLAEVLYRRFARWRFVKRGYHTCAL